MCPEHGINLISLIVFPLFYKWKKFQATNTFILNLTQFNQTIQDSSTRIRFESVNVTDTINEKRIAEITLLDNNGMELSSYHSFTASVSTIYYTRNLMFIQQVLGKYSSHIHYNKSFPWSSLHHQLLRRIIPFKSLMGLFRLTPL